MRRFLIILTIAASLALGIATAASAQVAPPATCLDGTRAPCGPGVGADDVYGAGIVVTQAPQALAFTGSSDSTPTMIYLGVAGVTAGLVLFVATRRRRSVLDHA